MRRVPRLGRSSCLPPSASRPSRAAAAHLGVKCSPTSSRSHHTSTPRHGPAPTSLPHPAAQFTRFYSSEKDHHPQGLAPSADSLQVEDPAGPDSEPPAAALEGALEAQQAHGPYLPPPERSYAERPDEVSDTGYMPALNAEGLKSVGGLLDWWNRSGNWDKSGDFSGFRPRRKVLDPAIIEVSVRRAVVEAFALIQAGREDKLMAAWPAGGQEDLQHSLAVGIDVAEGGAVSLTGPVSSVLDALNRTADEVQPTLEGAGEPSFVPSSEEAPKYKKAWGHGWKKVSLSDPRIRFAVTKRLFQLTGQLVPDHSLPSITDAWSVLRVVQKPPKPKTLTQEIQERHQDLVGLPNVSVATKRVTRGDKDIALGRFKLIEAELQKRGLPLLGYGSARKNKELSRLGGGT
ncbi:ribosomal subunit 39S-domain-containing protein [Durotheca rogersii]|uniref:ribosomal subunit 39S-domain-containing protein n=1 Tax=Durotheca rogersii TaxID=419775 RepID=UPI00221F6A33|nr:ribosomal subunit 39S-domain-containing protein [Durotheca rogersii]KAI5856684.1 ribosomal subunit 39S-domain-containing protein [Durotheca rogersii]